MTPYIDKIMNMCYTLSRNNNLRIMVVDKGKLFVRIGHKTIGFCLIKQVGQPVANNRELRAYSAAVE